VPEKGPSRYPEWLNDFVDHAANNSGIFLVTEFIMPLVILSLALYHRRWEPSHPDR
jgi:hypothetical protein